MDPLEISIAIFVGGAVIGAVGGGALWLHTSADAASDRRREAMMKRFGVDPKLLSLDDPQARTDDEITRRRCRHCRQEELCDRWLAGDATGCNAFCPNARMFRKLSDVGGGSGTQCRTIGDKIAA